VSLEFEDVLVVVLVEVVEGDAHLQHVEQREAAVQDRPSQGALEAIRAARVVAATKVAPAASASSSGSNGCSVLPAGG